MTWAEFAAKRRTSQDELIDLLMPVIEKALAHLGEKDWTDDLIDVVRDAYARQFRKEGGGHITLRRHFISDVLATLAKIKEVGPATAKSTATWLSTALINVATQDATDDDPQPLVLEWVTMHDDAVRTPHKDAEGQQRPVGVKFEVGGEKLDYPGDPKVSPSNFLNCRCVLAPTPQALVATINEEAAVEDDTVKQRQENPMTETQGIGAPLQWHGVLAPEGVWSGDGRQFAPDSLTFRTLPLPLTWQKASADGHGGSVVVGSIDKIVRRDGMMQAEGMFLDTVEADELVGLMAHFGKFGVSVDADDVEFEFQAESDKMMFTAARIASASAVPIPAFAEAFIALGPPEQALAASTWSSSSYLMPATMTTSSAPPAEVKFGRGPGWITNPVETKRLHDYWTKPGQAGYEKIAWGVPGDFNRCRVEVGQEIGENSPGDLVYLNQICAQWHHDATGFWPGRAPTEQALAPEGTPDTALHLVAAVPIVAPAAWFANPNLTGPTRLTVEESGRVFGHIAQWGTCHVGFKDVCVEPPFTNNDYAYFLNGDVLTDAGLIPVGHITAGGGHAAGTLSAGAAMAHYDSTSTRVADVTCGEDNHGIWVAGWVSPAATDEQIYTLRASSISGDWRDIGGNLELVAALAVNSPGFPISRVAAGVQKSLVAAGVVADRTPGDPVERIVDSLAEQVAAALERRQERREKMQALAARFVRES